MPTEQPKLTNAQKSKLTEEKWDAAANNKNNPRQAEVDAKDAEDAAAHEKMLADKEARRQKYLRDNNIEL